MFQGKTYENLGQTEKAKQSYEKVVELSKDPLYTKNSNDPSSRGMRKIFREAEDRLKEINAAEAIVEDPSNKTNGQEGSNANQKSNKTNSNNKPSKTKKLKKHKLYEKQNFQPAGPEAAFLSLAVPGLGQYKVNKYKRRSYSLITLAAYGMVGGGIYAKIRSNEIYKDHYLPEFNCFDAEEHYLEANRLHHTFIVLVAAGATVWLTDVGTVWAKGYRNRHPKKKPPRISVTPMWEPHPVSPSRSQYGLGLKMKL